MPSPLTEVPLKTVKLVQLLAFLSIAFNGLVSPCAFYLFILHKLCSLSIATTIPTWLIGPVMNNLLLFKENLSP